MSHRGESCFSNKVRTRDATWSVPTGRLPAQFGANNTACSPTLRQVMNSLSMPRGGRACVCLLLCSLSGHILGQQAEVRTGAVHTYDEPSIH